MKQYEAFGLTDRGREREENQDAFHIDEQNGLFLVADGVGGMEEGAWAALQITNGLGRRLREIVERHGASDLAELLPGEVTVWSRWLNQESQGRSGTTVVLACLQGTRAVVANVGDSPAYLFRRGELNCLTREHNVASLLAEQGMLSPEEARAHPLHHQLTSYVGMKKGVSVHVAEEDLEAGDRLLLCSDGLTGMLEEPEIERLLREHQEVEPTVRELIREANAAGGLDNVTAVLVELTGV